MQHIHVTVTGDNVVTHAIKDKRINDLRMALNIIQALGSGCNCIITENIKDFHFSKIEVFTSQQFLETHV